MAAWVLLRHDLPDGTWHHDWMLDPGRDATGALITFRLAPEVTWPPSIWFKAVRLADHRRDFLTYEGPVSAGRGTVRRVSRGLCEVREDGQDLIVGVDGRWFRGTRSGTPRRWERVGDGESLWEFWPIRNPADLAD